jgi:carbon storage regulator
MLVLSRRTEERINIGQNIEVKVLAISGNRVRLGILAPVEIPILRNELEPRIHDDPDSLECLEMA